MTITTLEGAKEVFGLFEKMNIVIIGDVMIDSYLFGDVERISPEAPVPIVSLNKRTHHLGGAANVALNIKAMGARPILCSVIGQDEHSETFWKLLNNNELTKGGILKSKDRITTVKFRIIGNNTQMLRVDEEMTESLHEEDRSTFLHIIQAVMEKQKIDAIIFQDYDKGVITPSLIQNITQLARNKNIPVCIDPKKKNFNNYTNATLFKPNLKELREGLKVDFDKNDKEKIRESVRQIHENQHIDIVMVTLSEEGVLISRRIEDGKYSEHHCPAHLRSIADVSGAGDTVISLAAMCLAAGLPDRETAALSNLAGGQVCEFVGVVPVNRNKLLDETSKLQF